MPNRNGYLHSRRPKFHPLCLLFPRLGDDELQELAEDIRQNGLQNDIITLDGKILDFDELDRLVLWRVVEKLGYLFG